ncbi:uncharacterized protein LOC143037313 [Oratosquilla oratoria]|uniref:uncharacterized protein LOC143037313 n=1 Tax=Oratosquilla oratoria TaxID=337810 RepID=UPI003F764453
MRPITSGIESAPHRLAKILAKPLSNTLGSISGAHLRNSTDLIERLKTIDFTDKRLVSYDVTALFTNVSVEDALEAVKRVVANKDDCNLPVPKADYIKLTSMCVKFRPFTFNNNEYKQFRGLAMGSPVSAILANLCMEMLETDKYMNIMGRGSTWLRYVDDGIDKRMKNKAKEIHNRTNAHKSESENTHTNITVPNAPNTENIDRLLMKGFSADKTQ